MQLFSPVCNFGMQSDLNQRIAFFIMLLLSYMHEEELISELCCLKYSSKSLSADY